MSKKSFFGTAFVIASLVIALFVANEYLKRIEIGAINSYLDTLKRELGDKQIALNFSQAQCTGFFKHSCKIDKIALDGGDSTLFKGKQIALTNTRLAITDLNAHQIALSVSIGVISHNLIFLPQNFAYTVRLTKQDSALGYVMLDRTLKMDMGNVAVSVDFAVLMREGRFRNKSIFFLLKEWLDPKSANVYEYSLERLNIALKAKSAINSAFYEANKAHLEHLSDAFHSENPHFESLKNATLKLMQNEFSRIDFGVNRKNANLAFFHTLGDLATTKKMLEIREILDSIDSGGYEINLNTK